MLIVSEPSRHSFFDFRRHIVICLIKAFFTILIGVPTMTHNAFAKAMFIPLPQKVAQSTLIARIQVLSVHSLTGAKLSECFV
jgi:hypothetical protein